MTPRRVIVVGAGPAGLSAAWETARAGNEVVVLEQDPLRVGGLAKTLEWNGCRFDIGAHRFFSKNPEMTQWWRERLPGEFIRIKRLTRILYRNRFFAYPLEPWDALRGLGVATSMACGLSYLRRRIAPIRYERSFADWVVNRFGDRLFRIFFKTYTEKVWGMPCEEISKDWASQRIRGLSLWRAVSGAFFGGKAGSIKTLVDEFDYPRQGAGQLWEAVKDDIERHGGRIMLGRTVQRLERKGNRMVAVETSSQAGRERWEADEFIGSMPLNDCALAVDAPLDDETQQAARRLRHRDFLLVVLRVKRAGVFPDQWIYVHDPAVKVGRIENYNNWGTDMVRDRSMSCLELEYFCNRNDDLWSLDDEKLVQLAGRELVQLGLARIGEISDGHVVRVEKAYPIYDAAYRENVAVIRRSLARITNLQVAGRNGMHKYNNQDHSMLTGLLSARNIPDKKHDVWKVNTDAEYLEDGEIDEDTGRLVPKRIQ